MTNWIDSLQVGDKVLDGDTLITVTAIHKLHVVCGSAKYRKSDGRHIKSAGWYRRFIREATAERLNDIAEKRLRSTLKYTIESVKFDQLETDTLQKIVDLIEADKGAE